MNERKLPFLLLALGIIVVLAMILLGCSRPESEPEVPVPPATTESAPVTPPELLPAPMDRYEMYLQIAPDKPSDWAGEWPLSREDAQTRALLGCEMEFAPGTIDAALREAYGDLCP